MLEDIKKLFTENLVPCMVVLVVGLVGGAILGNKVKFIKNMFNNGRTW